MSMTLQEMPLKDAFSKGHHIYRNKMRLLSFCKGFLGLSEFLWRVNLSEKLIVSQNKNIAPEERFFHEKLLKALFFF